MDSQALSVYPIVTVKGLLVDDQKRGAECIHPSAPPENQAPFS